MKCPDELYYTFTVVVIVVYGSNILQCIPRTQTKGSTEPSWVLISAPISKICIFAGICWWLNLMVWQNMQKNFVFQVKIHISHLVTSFWRHFSSKNWFYSKMQCLVENMLCHLATKIRNRLFYVYPTVCRIFNNLWCTLVNHRGSLEFIRSTGKRYSTIQQYQNSSTNKICNRGFP